MVKGEYGVLSGQKILFNCPKTLFFIISILYKISWGGVIGSLAVRSGMTCTLRT